MCEKTGNWQACSTGIFPTELNSSLIIKLYGTKALIIGTQDPRHGNMIIFIDDNEIETIVIYRLSNS